MSRIDDVRAAMDARYATKAAYSAELAYDRLMGREIRDAVLRLLGSIAADARSPALHTQPTLDVGCGHEGVAAFWPHTEIVGIELSEVAVAEARRRHPDVTYIATAVEDFGPEHTPLHGKFAMAVAIESIEHWVDVDRGLDAVRRALATSGHFIVTTPNRDSLHCRMARKLGREAPTVAHDHIHEFGFRELIERVEQHGFIHREATGVHLSPYWTLEHTIGRAIRALTDKDEEVLGWLNEIGRSMPPQYAYDQAHWFKKRIV